MEVLWLTLGFSNLGQHHLIWGVLRGWDLWPYLEFINSIYLESLLIGSGGPYWVLGIKSRSTGCKANVLLTAFFSLAPITTLSYLWRNFSFIAQFMVLYTGHAPHCHQFIGIEILWTWNYGISLTQILNLLKKLICLFSNADWLLWYFINFYLLKTPLNIYLFIVPSLLIHERNTKESKYLEMSFKLWDHTSVLLPWIEEHCVPFQSKPWVPHTRSS